jgi:Uma2 family endonuclease
LGRQVDAFAEPRRMARAFPELRTVFGGAAYVPDVAVYRWERIPPTAEGEVPDDFTEPPDIAVEIISPGETGTAFAQVHLVRRAWRAPGAAR